MKTVLLWQTKLRFAYFFNSTGISVPRNIFPQEQCGRLEAKLSSVTLDLNTCKKEKKFLFKAAIVPQFRLQKLENEVSLLRATQVETETK